MQYVIKTPCGKIGGVDCKRDGIVAYKGIRYANAKRFERPSEVTSWDEVYDASDYGPCAYQPRAFKNESEIPGKQFYYNEFRKDEEYKYSEDCLMLNIWTPKYVVTRSALEKYSKKDSVEDSLPVIIFIHGGSFTGGCGHEKAFDDPIWPICDVIAVTINYRLGPLGFMCLPELLEKEQPCTNLGLLDQLCAITWVKHNISAFGGNPDNITLMGQSAGAMSITRHMLSPLSNGFFNKVVLSSGGGISSFTAPKPAGARFEFWEKVMEKAGATTLYELKTIPVEDIFGAWQDCMEGMRGAASVCDPVIDGHIIVDEESVQAKKDEYVNCPMIIGINDEDFVGPVFSKMETDFVKCSSDLAHTFEYLFERDLPGDHYGAFHSADLWYWFGTLDNSWRPFEDADKELSKNMIMYLTNFAKTSDVNLSEILTADEDKTNTEGRAQGKKKANTGGKAQDKKETDTVGVKQDEKETEVDEAAILEGYILPKWKHSDASSARMIFGDTTQMGQLSFVQLVNNMIFHKSP